jgi:D-glycero-D-manno-heptose 1,7-bisphosphate phosphatase
MSTPALILDRDGVINIDHGYVHRVDQFDFIAGIFDLARYAVRELRWPVIVATNQSGIGRGLFDEAAYQHLTHWMCERFRAEQAPIARVYHCPHHPEHGVGDFRRDHPWRKPNPGILLQAKIDFDLDLAQCVLIGDRDSDIAAAAAAGVGTRMWLFRADTALTPPAQTHIVVRDLGEALAILRGHRDVG